MLEQFIPRVCLQSRVRGLYKPQLPPKRPHPKLSHAATVFFFLASPHPGPAFAIGAHKGYTSALAVAAGCLALGRREKPQVFCLQSSVLILPFSGARVRGCGLAFSVVPFWAIFAHGSSYC